MSRPAGHETGERRRVDDAPLLGRVVVDVLVGARRQEARERMHDRQHAAQRHAARRRHHVLLGDPALDEAIGQLRLERLDAAIRQQIRIHHDDLGALTRHREQLVTVGEHDLLGRLRRHSRRQRRRRQHRRLLVQPLEPLVHARDQFTRRRHVVLERRRAGVEVIGLIAAGEAFHERHALALDGVGNEHLGLVGDGLEMRERVAQHAEVVAVAAAHFPAEDAEFLFERAEIAHRGDRACRTETCCDRRSP